VFAGMASWQRPWVRRRRNAQTSEDKQQGFPPAPAMHQPHPDNTLFPVAECGGWQMQAEADDAQQFSYSMVCVLCPMEWAHCMDPSMVPRGTDGLADTGSEPRFSSTDVGSSALDAAEESDATLQLEVSRSWRFRQSHPLLEVPLESEGSAVEYAELQCSSTDEGGSAFGVPEENDDPDFVYESDDSAGSSSACRAEEFLDENTCCSVHSQDTASPASADSEGDSVVLSGLCSRTPSPSPERSRYQTTSCVPVVCALPLQEVAPVLGTWIETTHVHCAVGEIAEGAGLLHSLEAGEHNRGRRRRRHANHSRRETFQACGKGGDDAWPVESDAAPTEVSRPYSWRFASYALA